MKSDRLDLKTAEEAIGCLKTAAGEIEHALEILQARVAIDDLAEYKRMTGKIIIAIYSGQVDSILEGFPELQKSFYSET